MRLSVAVDESQRATLRSRARAFGVPMAEYLRASALGVRPAQSTADAWWDGLSQSRKAQVHGWLTTGRGREPENPAAATMPLPFPVEHQ